MSAEAEMAKTVNRLALQQSLVRNGIAEDPAAGNVADDWGDEIDAVTADLATKEDLDVFGKQLLAAVDLRLEKMQAEMNEGLSKLRLGMETRDKERAERESEWWRLQQERDDKWRAEQQKREDDWRAEQQKREDDWHKEQRERDRESSKATSRILWAIFGSAGAISAVIAIVAAVT